MKQEEKQFLYNEKISGGKSEMIANDEIKQLEYSNIVFKEKEKEITKLKNIIKKLELKLEKEINKKGKSKNFKKQFLFDTKIEEIKNSNDIGTTRDLSRILCLLEEPMGLDELTKTARLKTKACKNCLCFLEKFKIINLTNDGVRTIIKSNLQ